VDDVATEGGPRDRAASVVVVDNDGALCELLRNRLNDEPDLVCAGLATTAEAARELIAERRPQVVILDFGLGRGVDSIDLVAELVERSPASQVLIWTKWTDPSPERGEEILRKVRALRNGASDWVAKGDGIDVLVERIREAVRRGPPSRTSSTTLSPIEASLGALLALQGHAGSPVAGTDDGLTPAERRAAEATALGLERGLKIDQVARTLRISIQTLRTHLRSIYAKWQVHAQAEFVAEARRRGLMNGPDAGSGNSPT
jgi:two-component system, NarL family, response regulator LiaR